MDIKCYNIYFYLKKKKHYTNVGFINNIFATLTKGGKSGTIKLKSADQGWDETCPQE